MSKTKTSDKALPKFVIQGNPFEFIPNEIKTKDSVFWKKLRKKIVYLWEDESETLIKSIPPGDKYMAKIPPDGKEFQIAPDSDQVARATAAEWEVTKQEYDKNKAPAGAT